MKRQHRLTKLLALVLTAFTLATANVHAVEKEKKAYEKPGYAVDGRTSASVLSAKRSHEVAKEDEIGLAVFSGLFVIAIIGFFSHEWFKRK